MLAAVGGVCAGLWAPVLEPVARRELSAEEQAAGADPAKLLIRAGLVLYPWVLERRYGATVGKMALGLRIVTREGLRMGYMRALVRAFLRHFLGAITGWLMTISIATNREHRLA